MKILLIIIICLFSYVQFSCAKQSTKDQPNIIVILSDDLSWSFPGFKVYSENIIMDKLLTFLDNNNPKDTDKPFFIYFPSQLPHGPIMIPEVHKDFKNNLNLTEHEKEYASMVKMLDTDVGRIYNKVKQMGMLDNTIFVFTSDNGHEVYYPKEGRTNTKANVKTGEKYDNIHTKFYTETSGDIFDGNDGMAGLKRDNWEGGVRVPLIWYWKGKIKPGQVSNQMVSNYDFLNTLAELLDVPNVEGKDGVSYAKTLFGGKSKERDYTVYSSKIGPGLATKKGWKLRYAIEHDIFQFYYLPDDYREENNLAAKYPERVEKLKTLLLKECSGDWNNGLGPVKLAFKDYYK